MFLGRLVITREPDYKKNQFFKRKSVIWEFGRISILLDFYHYRSPHFVNGPFDTKMDDPPLLKK